MSDRITSIADLRQRMTRIMSSSRHTTGNWTTGQIFYHLAAAFEASIEGLPSGYPAIVRLAIRPFRGFVTGVRFPPWVPIPSATAFKLLPPEDTNVDEQYERLARAIDRFESCHDDLPPHPVLGRLTRSEWTGFHLRHCQHHLAFICTEDIASPSVGPKAPSVDPEAKNECCNSSPRN